MDKLCSLDEAVSLIKNYDTVNITASGGGFMDADLIYRGIEKRFLETGEPNNLTLMHVTGVGSGNETGIGRFAHKGLVKRVVGGHWLWSKKMGRMALDEEIEAYNLPQGVLALLTREIAAGRPGLLTTVGLHTFIDPRVEGGRMNKGARDPLVELIRFQGREMLFPSQFDFYHGGGLDMAFLGMGEADPSGNVNVSRLGKRITGSGGFIDISQTAKTVVFCGTFTNGEILVEARDGNLMILKEGENKKFRNQVGQISFSGEFAAQKGQQVFYVTERAVFKLENRKMVLTEIAPGVDLQKDILAQMEFTPAIARDLRTMDPAVFKPEKMRLNGPTLFSRFDEG